MGKKLTLIGGGSVRTYYFIESLMAFYKEMEIEEVAVMDNDSVKLKYFGGIAKYLCESKGCDLKVTLTEDSIEAIKDADYVVTTVRAGQDEARTKDERLALNLGVIGQETTGAGGFSYAIRTIPTMIEYMSIIRKYAKPNAPVFNFTNPSGLVTQALYDAGYDNIIGICDNATGIKIDCANALKVNASDLLVKVYGLNHLSWANYVEIGGKNVLPKLMESEAFIQNFHQFAYFDRDLIRRLREIPNGYLYYFYHRKRALENLLNEEESRGEFICRNNKEMMAELLKHDIDKEPQVCLDIYRDYMHRRESTYMSKELGDKKVKLEEINVDELGIDELSESREVTEIYEGYAGIVFNYIKAQKTGKPIDLAISVPNRGAIPGMADDDVVEITCIIDDKGTRPMTFTKEEIPESNLSLMKTIKRYEKLTIEAVMKKSKKAAIEALMIHPLVMDYDIAKQLVEVYTKKKKKWIGEWN
ncbi:MAG: glycoside hydrolase [Clostridia bacterium]|nr:glycoside hydrolase [Clostridia bacterium]